MRHPKKIFVVVLLMFLLITPEFLSIAESPESPAPSEKAQLSEEEGKKIQKQAVEERKKIEKLQETLTQQEKAQSISKQHEAIFTHQQKVQAAINRAVFPFATVALSKKTFKVGEPITFTYTLKNGSKASFFIDGRKFTPTYEVRDAAGKIVLVGKEKTRTSPAGENFTLLEPGRTFGPFSGESFSLSKEGTYTLRAIYTLAQPEEFDLQIWSGQTKTFPVTFQVKEKVKK